MKKFLYVIITLFLLPVCYIVYGQYQHARFVESLLPHVKSVSLRVTNSSRYETEKDSLITYKELFERLEADITEVDKQVLEVQTLSSPKTADTTVPAVDYLKACQEYLRALLFKYRKHLVMNSAAEWAKKSQDELPSFRSYGYDYARRSLEQAFTNRDKAEKEYRESLPGVVAAATKLDGSRAKLVAIFTDDALVPTSQLDAVVQKNSPESDQAVSTTR